MVVWQCSLSLFVRGLAGSTCVHWVMVMNKCVMFAVHIPIYIYNPIYICMLYNPIYSQRLYLGSSVYACNTWSVSLRVEFRSMIRLGMNDYWVYWDSIDYLGSDSGELAWALIEYGWCMGAVVILLLPEACCVVFALMEYEWCGSCCYTVVAWGPFCEACLECSGWCHVAVDSWHLQTVLHALDFHHLSPAHRSVLHCSFSAQLQSLGLWHWSVLPLLHIDSSRRWVSAWVAVEEVGMSVLQAIANRMCRWYVWHSPGFSNRERTVSCVFLHAGGPRPFRRSFNATSTCPMMSRAR